MQDRYAMAASRLVSFVFLISFLVVSNVLAAQPSVGLNPSSLSFANQLVGSPSSPQQVTLTNTGNASLSITKIKISSGNSGDFSQTNNCGSSLKANASCTINVTFTPAKLGNLSSDLSITDNASGSPQLVPVSGVGAAPAVTLSPANLTFSGVPIGSSSSPASITVTNSGTATLTIANIAASGDFSQTNTCSSPIGAGSTCTINVTFTPTEVWSRGGSIVLTDNAYQSPQQVAFLLGMGNSGAAVKLSTKSLGYGSVPVGTTTSAKTVTLTNSGSAALNLNSIIASGDYTQTNNCPASLNANSNCTINITFTPSATGARTGYLTFSDTDPSLLQSVALNGTGTVPNAQTSVNPQQASLTPFQAQQFTVAIGGVNNPSVTWYVDGIAGGNSTVGTISSAGLYTPPSMAGSHIIRVTNNNNSNQTAVAFVGVDNFAGTFTGKNDNMRTGQNLSEFALTTGNVNRNQFGKLFSYAVDGYVFAQPLYVEGVNIPNQGIHDVVYVATEGDSVFAFDADNNGAGGGQLWQTSFTNPAEGVTTIPQADVENGNDIPVQIGITGTPVIDPTINTLFVVVRTKEVTNGVASYVQRLHALDITTGAEQAGSPVVISASISGTGIGSSGGTLSFDGLRENPRPALLLTNGIIYVCWASLEDIEPFHGWIISFEESPLQQVSVFNTTPNGEEGGIWMGGGGMVADDEGNLFVSTGNGTFDANIGGVDYGDTVLKLTPSMSGLSVGDYFTPYNQSYLASQNWDLAAGGPVVLPDQPGAYPHVMLAAGKGGAVFEINRDSMGGFNSSANQNLLTIPLGDGNGIIGSGNRAAGPAYWQESVYFSGSSVVPNQYSMQNGLISVAPAAQWTVQLGYPGGSPVISANGNTNGIVWVVQTDRYNSMLPAILRAFDAANISRQLYNSSDDASRDTAGPAVKFVVPTVANGKVFLGTETELDVYGLLP